MAKLVCTLEMSKERGVTITVENAEGKITQTLHMDGTTVTLTVKGEAETSSWTQKAESIAISCKDFTLSASNSITCTAAQTATYESTGGDTTIKSGAKLIAQASADVTVSSDANVALSATSKASMKGMTAEVTGTQSLALKGTGEASLAGAKVAVTADGQLALSSSGIAELKGSMTTIGGSLIKAG